MANGLIVQGAGERSYRGAERVRAVASGCNKTHTPTHTHTHTGLRIWLANALTRERSRTRHRCTQKKNIGPPAGTQRQEVATSALCEHGSGAPRRRVLRGPCLCSNPPGKKIYITTQRIATRSREPRRRRRGGAARVGLPGLQRSAGALLRGRLRASKQICSA
jgi:hypothetical protein